MAQDYAKQRAETLEELDGLRVEIDKEKRIGWLVLDREPLNIVSYRARPQITAVIEAFDRDDDIGVVVIRGAGGIFTSGGDVRGFFEVPRNGMSDLSWNISAPARCSKPVICAMEKYAFGVGFELSLACDFRLATTGTLVGLPEVSIGQIPGSGGAPRLTSLVGLTRAKKMIYLGERVPAETALDWGILTDVAEDQAALDAMIDQYAARLNALSPLALATIKRVMNTAFDSTLDFAMNLEGQAYEKLRDSYDYTEGATAFFEKRKAVYKGE
ncbi:MAG: enoyl-CoA hydratase/isomerase family protein [Rhodospirillales bacterium]|jgi:2-oxoglutaroyl-CoA hydrolase